MALHIIQADNVEQNTTSEEGYDLRNDRSLSGDGSENTADEIAGSRRDILNGNGDRQVLISLLGISGNVDNIVGKTDEGSANEDAGKHTGKEDHGLSSCQNKQDLPQRVSDTGNGQTPFGGHITAKDAPEGREEKVQEHLGGQRRSEHGAVQGSFHDEGGSHRMGETGSCTEQTQDNKE